MKLNKVAGATSEIWQVFIQDTTSSTGAGLTGLTNASSGLTAYYHRDTDTTATAIALVSMTVGTFTSSGFKEIDATNMPGWYQLCPPNAALASGAKSCGIALKGATNMAPLNIEVQLMAVNPDSATAFITGVNSVAPPTNWNLTSIDSNGRVDVIKIAGTTQTARDIGASVLLSTGTGTGQLDFTSGVVKTNTTQILGTAVSTPATAGILDVNLKNIANATVSTSTAQLGVNAVNLGGTAQTGRDIGASVLLSSGTGTGQLDFTSGVVKANLAQILGTALTETAGLIAAGFKKFFNVATPTGTVNSIPDAIAGASGGLFIAGSNAATTANITGNITGNLSGSVGSLTTNNDKTGYALSTLGIQAIWDALTSALTTVGSIGKLIVTNLDAVLSSVQTAVLAKLPSALVSGRIDASVGAYQSGLTPLQPTVSGRTLDVSTGGEAGIDWANVGSPTTTLGLSGTTVKAVTDGVTLTAGQLLIKKNTSFSAFEFPMYDSSGNLATGLTVTGTRSIDGGAATALTNAAVEISGGFYKVDLTAAELNGSNIGFKMSATGANPTTFTIITQA